MTTGTPGLGGLLSAARRRWRARIVLRGGLAALALAGGLSLLLLGAGALGLVPASARPFLRWLPVLAALLLLGAALVRALVRAPDDRTLALRAEEAAPELEHLPTVLLGLPADHPYAPELHRQAGTRLAVVTPGALVPLRPTPLEGATVAGLILFGGAAVGLAGGPAAACDAFGPRAEPAVSSSTPEALAAPPVGETDPLEGIRIRVSPPPYTGLQTVEAPLGEGIRALEGSRIELLGPPTPAPSPRVHLVRSGGEPEPMETTSAPDAWAAGWVLAMGDRGLVLSSGVGDGLRERVVPLHPRPDDPPRVELLEPERDMVLARGSGEVTFRARALDPFGLDGFELTWVHTRGSGESFDFREGRAQWSRAEEGPGGVEGTVSLHLEDLELGPGDVLHLRAVATDRNDATGPRTGVSATRRIEVVREGEEHFVDALIGFPLEGDPEPILSQRMILLLTESLLARSAGLTPAEFRREVEEIAEEQGRLRVQIGGQIYSRDTGAMEPPSVQAAGDTHAHTHDEPGLPTPLHAGHDHEEASPGATAQPATPQAGSRFGVASVFDPAATPAPAPPPVPDLSFPDPDPAGTQVGAVTIGGAGSAPVGFGVLDEEGHDHDGDPILSIHRPLLEIHDAMWEAERRLRLVEPAGSIPFQEEVIEALQALRENERVFPRGRVTVPPVDVPGARGTGEVDDAEPATRTAGTQRTGADRWARELEALLLRNGDGEGGASGPPPLAAELTSLAVALLGDPAVPTEAAGLVARAGEALAREQGEDARAEAREGLRSALALLDPEPLVDGTRTARSLPSLPSSPAAAAFGPAPVPSGDAPLADGSTPDPSPADPSPAGPSPAGPPSPEPGPDPLVFATLRYESGNWDSAPLVPQNLIHALAQYTDVPLDPSGVIVDLSSEEIFRYPLLFLTGHLPVRFSDAEARNLEAYVRRGGFVFMDDHNHDVDGAFHRTATAELARIFGPEALEPLPNDHELYHTFFAFEDGPPTTLHELSGWGDGMIHPELHAVLVDGRIGVLYSNKDYASEWSYHAVNKRFLAVDNTRFGVNLILYALTR